MRSAMRSLCYGERVSMKTQPRHPRKIPFVLPEETSPVPVTNTDDSEETTTAPAPSPGNEEETTSNSNLVDDATTGSDSPTVPGDL